MCGKRPLSDTKIEIATAGPDSIARGRRSTAASSDSERGDQAQPGSRRPVSTEPVGDWRPVGDRGRRLPSQPTACTPFPLTAREPAGN